MALIYHKQLPVESHLGVWQVEESIEVLTEKLILDEEEWAFFKSLNKGKRNLHWLSSRVLIRQLLNTDHFIEVRSDESGKPHLVNFPYELSISHSEDYAAVIIGKNRVGIDIEQIQEKIRKIAHKFMRDEEREQLQNFKDSYEPMYVFWGVKESLYKLYGKRQLNFRNHMQLKPFDYRPPGTVEARIMKDDWEASFKVHYERINGYMLTYVIEGEDEG